MSYIDQFYKEGLATTFYQGPTKFIKKKIKNKNIADFLCLLIKIFYTVFAVLFAILMFIVNFPL